MENPTLVLAFVAGLISFISPCVLPLVPAYVGYMGGRMTNTVARATAGGGSQVSTTSASQRFTTATHSLFFIAGFTLVFVGIGLLSTAFVRQVGGANVNTLTELIGRIGGVIIIFFGLHFMGVLPGWLARLRSSDSLLTNPLTSVAFAVVGSALILWGFSGNVFIWDSVLWADAVWSPFLGLLVLCGFIIWLFLSGAFTNPAYFWKTTIDRLNNAFYADTRRDMHAADSGGFGSSIMMGVVFSAGWTPCIGPVYGAVLTMAAGGGDVAQAGSLLAAYSLGLGVPFLVTALALDSAQSILRRLQRHMHKIEFASGAFLIIIGLMVASGQLQRLSATLSTDEFAQTAINIETQVIDAITGETPPENTVPTPVPDESFQESAAVIPTSGENPILEVNTITGLADTGEPSIGIAPGNLAPDFETVTDTGKPIRLSDYRGDIVLLNFWATWCGPCRIEMPEFEAVYNEHKEQGFTIIAVNNGETVADVQGFRDEYDLSFTLAMDERADIQNQYNIFGYPSTFILNRDGTILARHPGPLTADQLRELVNTALTS